MKPEAWMLIIICPFIDSFYVMLLKEQHRNTQYTKGTELRYVDRPSTNYWHMP